MYSWIKYNKVIVNYEYEGMLNECALRHYTGEISENHIKTCQDWQRLSTDPNTGTCAHETDVLTNTVKGCVCTYILVYNTSSLLHR
jgi:hypothetical protein